MSTPELPSAQRPLRAPSALPLSRGLAPLALVLLPLGLGACQPPGESGGPGQVDAAAVRERQLPRILAEPLRQQEMVAVRETTCTLESEFEVALMPRIAARVIALRAEEGDRVQAGDVLVELEQTDQALALRDAEIAVEEAEQELENSAIAIDEANSRLKASQSALEQAERDYERDAELSRGGSSGVASVSQKAFEQSQLAYSQAQQDLAQADLALSRAQLDQKKATTAVSRAVVARDRAAEELAQTRLRAPFDGVIAERQVRVGQMSSTAESAFTLTDPDRLRAVFFRPQRELGLFASALTSDAPPLELTATTDALPEFVFEGSIQRVSPTIDPTSGNFRVTASIEPVPLGGDQAELLPGMLLRVRIVTDRHENALVVPKRAVQREGGESYLFELAQGDDGGYRAVRIPVIEGFSSEDDVEITPVEPGRLDETATIITVGARDLSDGDAVEWAQAADASDAGAAAGSQAEAAGEGSEADPALEDSGLEDSTLEDWGTESPATDSSGTDSSGTESESPADPNAELEGAETAPGDPTEGSADTDNTEQPVLEGSQPEAGSQSGAGTEDPVEPTPEGGGA